MSTDIPRFPAWAFLAIIREALQKNMAHRHPLGYGGSRDIRLRDFLRDMEDVFEAAGVSFEFPPSIEEKIAERVESAPCRFDVSEEDTWNTLISIFHPPGDEDQVLTRIMRIDSRELGGMITRMEILTS